MPRHGCRDTACTGTDRCESCRPIRTARSPHRDAAIGRFGLGDTIRTDRFRYTRYPDSRGEARHMLYDHEADPAEDHNLADEPAYADLVVELRARLANATD